MNTKDKIKNDILVKMSNHLNTEQMSILTQVLTVSFFNVEMEEETALANIDNSNEYVINLFKIKKAPKLSKSTVEMYLKNISELSLICNRNLMQISQNDIEYFMFIKQQTISCGRTLNNYLRNLSAFFTWMRKAKLITENPCDGIERYPEIENPVEHFEALEMEEIRKACRTKRQRAMVELLRSTAIRRGEVPLIKVKDIDFSSGKIQVFGQKTRTYRTVYIDAVTKKYLKLYLNDRIYTDPDGQLFTTKVGRKFESKDVYEIIHGLQKKLNMKKLRPHVFRKTCATNICRRGGSEEMAGHYLGHRPKTVTGKHYTYRSEQYTEEIFRKYVEAI